MKGLGALLALGDTVDSMDGSSVSITSGSPSDDSNMFSAGDSGPAIQITGDDDGPIIAASKNGNVFVDFNAKWCGPCRAFGPVVEQLAGEYPGRVFKVDTDANPGLANKYGISSIPSLMIMSNGQIGKRGTGGSGISTLRQWMGASAPVSAPSVTSSGSPTVADTVVASTTTYAGAEGWGNPPDNSGWKQVLLDGKKYWNKGGANGQFTAASQTTGAAVVAPTLVTQTTDQVSSPPVVYGKVPSPLFSTPTPSTAPAASVAPSGNVSVTVNVAADQNAWSYILQKGNAKWQAVILDGVHAFRNKNTGSFQKGESIRGLSGMRMGGLGFAGIAGFLGAVTVSVPTYTTVKGGGGSIGKTVGIVAGSVVGIGLLGYLIYRAVR